MSINQRLAEFLNENFSLQERIAAFKKRKLYTLEIELTKACNLSCVYCYAEAEKKGQNLSLEKAKEILKQAKEYDIKEICWLGGEPLLNPDWFEIVQHSKSLELKNQLWSNGTRLSKENVKKIIKVCDIFVLHLDTVNPTNFALVQRYKRGVEKKHKNILDGLDELLKQGFPPEKIRLNLTLTRSILKDLDKTMSYFINKKGISTITLIPLYLCGKGKSMPGSEFLSSDELYKAFKKRSEIEKRAELMVLGTAEFCKYYQLTNAYIKVNGDITPYAGIDIKVGNIYQDNLKKVLKKSFKALSFSILVNSDGRKNKIKGPCGACESSEYCFGTRTSAYIKGNISKSDQTCWKVKNA